MAKLRLLLAMGKPRILMLMCGLALAGAVLSPDFLSPAFPETRLGRLLQSPPRIWSLAHAVGAALVVGLLWVGTAIIAEIADRSVNAIGDPGRPAPDCRMRPTVALRWALGAQALAFLLVLAEGSRQAMTLALIGAGLGNAYSLPPLRFRGLGTAAHLIVGGGATLAITGGLIAQTGATEVGLLSAGALGVLAAAVSLIKEFQEPDADRAAGVRTLPILVGIRAAVYINMAAVVGAYLLALFLLIHTIGVHEKVIAVFFLPLGANLSVLHRLAADRSPETARRAYDHAVIIYMGVTALYVGAQAIY
ncbi:MAG TPA: UbiA family prenyltransferase [Symbiobacteriaceae bacterium]|nr:UbiA family prenyltransferase [Symbiobacteriaceae bacterium]